MRVHVSMMTSSPLDRAFELLSAEVNEWYSDVRVLPEPPTALEFSRIVASNRPVVIKNAVNEWPAMCKWHKPDYMRARMKGRSVTVDVTPDARCDCIVGDKFVTPLVEQMRFDDFMDVFEGKKSDNDGYYTVQHQNSNMDEFEPLAGDVGELDFAREAFGDGRLDATNIWMGPSDQQSSSLHKDPYCNIYVVVQGEKLFTLLPPTDIVYVEYQNVPLAQYARKNNPLNSTGTGGGGDGGGFDVVPVDNGQSKVSWIPHGNDELENAHPNFHKMSPLYVHLIPGDVLYLPPLWFHRVKTAKSQTIAVNFWYDMTFDFNYCYFRFLEHLVSNNNEAEEHDHT